MTATAAVVAEHAEQITGRFYPRMFAEHPELLRVFNQGNQATGEQSQALAGAVVAYAVHLIDPDAPSFDHVMKRIAYKHVSLGIRPEQYTIVGHHLLAAVGEVLGDAVTPEVADAWGEVYWLFAAQLIAEEARLYQQAGVDPAHAVRPYRVVRRIEETADVISLVLEPVDGGDLPEVRPGQYVSVFVDLPGGDRQPRQYTVSSTAFGTRLQITVRRVRGVNGAPDGRVSSLPARPASAVGDLVDVSAPAGDFVVDPSDGPLLLASAGRRDHHGAADRRAHRPHPAGPHGHRGARRPDRAGPRAAGHRAARGPAHRRLHRLHLVRDGRPGRSPLPAGFDGPVADTAARGRAGVHLRAAAVHAARQVDAAGQGRAAVPDPVRGLRPGPVGRPGGKRLTPPAAGRISGRRFPAGFVFHPGWHLLTTLNDTIRDGTQ